MTTFVQDFVPSRGDLIYGRGEVRSAYLTALPLDAEQSAAATGGAWIFLDFYNNAYGTSGKAFAGGDPPTPASVNTYVDDVQGLLRDAKPGVPFVVNAKEARRTSYYELLRARDSRFAPSAAFDLSRKELKKQGQAYPKWYKQVFSPKARRAAERAHVQNVGTKGLRRVCKLGISMVASEQAFAGAKILFLLDGLDIGMVARKDALAPATSPFVPITSSELRHCFRHWATLQSTVQFYVNGSSVDPPWITDWDLPNIPDTATPRRWGDRVRAEKAAWDGYAQRRLDKYGGSLPNKPLF